MKKLNSGFYCALGTPVDKDGLLIEESLKKHIEDQINGGASGLLLMGSMGMEPCIRDDAYALAAKVASETVKGRIPLFVGVMDCSSWRVKDRIKAIENLDITAVVLTPPFYFGGNNDQLLKFFTDVADYSPYPVYLYDLPGATKIKITFDMVSALAKHSNIKGIKSGDIVLLRQIMQQIPDFEALYSNLDAFDVAMSYGVTKVLDGMFSCTPKNGKAFVDACAKGDFATAADKLNKIIHLRDTFVKYSVFPAFTAAMNALGFNGNFAPDFCGEVTAAAADEIVAELKNIGEI